jgi:hypothetical protein
MPGRVFGTHTITSVAVEEESDMGMWALTTTVPLRTR